MRTIACLVVAVLSGVGLFAQSDIIPLDKVVRSQRGTVSQKIANTDITITYGRPVARGRTLFGSLVPYGRMWHPGADAATALDVTRDVQVNGQALPKGSVSLGLDPRAIGRDIRDPDGLARRAAADLRADDRRAAVLRLAGLEADLPYDHMCAAVGGARAVELLAASE